MSVHGVHFSCTISGKLNNAFIADEIVLPRLYQNTPIQKIRQSVKSFYNNVTLPEMIENY